MKYCSKCGNELMDEAVICPKCGCAVGNQYQGVNMGEDKATGGMIAVSILIPLVGIIYGVIEKGKGHVNAGNTYIKAAVITWVICIVLSGVSGLLFAIVEGYL